MMRGFYHWAMFTHLHACGEIIIDNLQRITFNYTLMDSRACICCSVSKTTSTVCWNVKKQLHIIVVTIAHSYDQISNGTNRYEAGESKVIHARKEGWR